MTLMHTMVLMFMHNQKEIDQMLVVAAFVVIVSMLTLSVVDRGFKLHSAETRDFNIGIVSSAKHTGLRSNSKNWLARIQYNVFQWRDMSACRHHFFISLVLAMM